MLLPCESVGGFEAGENGHWPGCGDDCLSFEAVETQAVRCWSAPASYFIACVVDDERGRLCQVAGARPVLLRTRVVDAAVL